MRSWQQMREFSYVGIKLTKAKTISEGLTKCKIQKLTRQNPLYEHIKLHRLMQGRKRCTLCSNAHSPPRGKTAPLSSPTQSPRRTRTMRLHSQRGLMQQSPQAAVSVELDRLQEVLGKFGEGLRRTRSQFTRMQEHSRLTTRYFLTEADELAEQIDEGRAKIDTIDKVKSARMDQLEEAEAEHRRRRETEREVRKLNRTVKFPLDEAQMRAVVHQARQKQGNAKSQLNRMMSSLYEYKAKANYANKMKAIRQYHPQ